MKNNKTDFTEKEKEFIFSSSKELTDIFIKSFEEKFEGKNFVLCSKAFFIHLAMICYSFHKGFNLLISDETIDLFLRILKEDINSVKDMDER